MTLIDWINKRIEDHGEAGNIIEGETTSTFIQAPIRLPEKDLEREISIEKNKDPRVSGRFLIWFAGTPTNREPDYFA